MPETVLHLLSQRPLLTGSGITLDAFVRLAKRRGWKQHTVIGVPATAGPPEVGGLERECIHPLFFGTEELDFPVPGMSDVMPYESTRFSAMTAGQWKAYESAWREHLKNVVQAVRPDVIHAHHVWLLSALVKEVAPSIPVAVHCHATGLRQMELCPHLAPRIREAQRRSDLFFALHRGHAESLATTLGIPSDRIRVIGAGFNEQLFHPRGRSDPRSGRVVYVGKISPAKGLTQLLDALERLEQSDIEIELHIAGSGAGDEAAALKRRIGSLRGLVQYHGQLDQMELAQLMRTCCVCVLPSFYEGLPLVLVEALACGCRLVSTNLPGVREELVPHLQGVLELVPLPRLKGTDIPLEDDLPAFVDNLASALKRAVAMPPIDVTSDGFRSALEPFTWSAVYQKVEQGWEMLRRA